MRGVRSEVLFTPSRMCFYHLLSFYSQVKCVMNFSFSVQVPSVFCSGHSLLRSVISLVSPPPPPHTHFLPLFLFPNCLSFSLFHPSLLSSLPSFLPSFSSLSSTVSCNLLNIQQISSTFPMLPPFSTLPHVVVISSLKSF